MTTGQMQFGADNNAGTNQPTQTILRAQSSSQATLVVRNESQLAGNGLSVSGGWVGVEAIAGSGSDSFGVTAEGGTGVFARSSGTGNGVIGRSSQRNGVQGDSSSQIASGVYGENLSYGGFGVAGRSNAPGLPPGAPGWGSGVLGDNTAGGWAGIFNGGVLVTESLSVLGDFFHSGSGFLIDNPVDPANSYLSHSFVESPDMMNVYNGNVTTDTDGNATVELPSYFEALNRDFRYQLTVVGQFAAAMVAEEVMDNHFVIRTDRPNVIVSWQVTGIRKDAWANAHRRDAENPKPEGERGKYLTPREHGQAASAGLYHVQLPASSDV